MDRGAALDYFTTTNKMQLSKLLKSFDLVGFSDVAWKLSEHK